MAPPDVHLALEDSKVRLSRGPAENGHRPAVDVLFRTAARAYRRRVVGVVLTGNLDDGTSGLSFVKHHGGVAVVQDPEEADYRGMPESALLNVAVDHVLPIAAIGPLLDSLARSPVLDEPHPVQDGEDLGMEWQPEHEIEPGGQPSGLTCPACGGALWESSAGGLLHFRCRTGHAYSPESLEAEQSESLEAALWAALRSLEENSALARRMAERLNDKGSLLARRYLRKAQATEKHIAQIRAVLYDKPESEK